MPNTSFRTTQTEKMDTSPTTTRLKEFGNWKEKTGFGRRYYYNIITKISQWEKPIEWKHAEKLKISAGLKNGYNNNKSHNSVIQQTPKKTKTTFENGKRQELYPSIRIQQYQQAHFNKHSNLIGPASAPVYSSQQFWPATPPNTIKPPQKLYSPSTMTTSASKLLKQLYQVETSTDTTPSICTFIIQSHYSGLSSSVFAGSKFTGSPAAKSLPLPPSQWLSPSTIKED